MNMNKYLNRLRREDFFWISIYSAIIFIIVTIISLTVVKSYNRDM